MRFFHVEKIFIFSELPEEMLSLKEKFCHDVLKCLELLTLGSCRLRGKIAVVIVIK